MYIKLKWSQLHTAYCKLYIVWFGTTFILHHTSMIAPKFPHITKTVYDKMLAMFTKHVDDKQDCCYSAIIQ